MAQAYVNEVYGKLESIEFTRKDGIKEKSLSTRLNSQFGISVNRFSKNDVIYIHINKKNNKYYLPLQWEEMEDSVKIKTEIEEKLHLLGDDVSDINFIFIYLFFYFNKSLSSTERTTTADVATTANAT